MCAQISGLGPRGGASCSGSQSGTHAVYLGSGPWGQGECLRGRDAHEGRVSCPYGVEQATHSRLLSGGEGSCAALPGAFLPSLFLLPAQGRLPFHPGSSLGAGGNGAPPKRDSQTSPKLSKRRGKAASKAAHLRPFPRRLGVGLGVTGGRHVECHPPQ
ncbi:Hypothetical predicted protein [Podarcis lilfordi]|uniref:Uncharacterized protein n=1 Tax=Podarcis lilfordi TaxID=74358 RepID=A0AA35P9A5_9SAUR|nr:Hypothetical predicted protein [Podarcis lilfordi]